MCVPWNFGINTLLSFCLFQMADGSLFKTKDWPYVYQIVLWKLPVMVLPHLWSLVVEIQHNVICACLGIVHSKTPFFERSPYRGSITTFQGRSIPNIAFWIDADHLSVQVLHCNSLPWTRHSIIDLTGSLLSCMISRRWVSCQPELTKSAMNMWPPFSLSASSSR